MGLAVVTVAAGGTPVVETPFGTPVTEAINKYGVPVTKVVGKPGLPVVFETIGLPPAVAPVGLDPTTAVAVTLSNGNLTVTNTGTTATNQGARGFANIARTSGKYYFEVRVDALPDGTANNRCVGIGTISGTYPAMGTNGGDGSILFYTRATSNVWSNATNLGITVTPYGTVGATICVAADLDNKRIWFRVDNGNWNGNVANNPATNTGGVAIVHTTPMVPFIVFGGTLGVAGNSLTANFGATAYAQAVPAGFVNWPAAAAVGLGFNPATATSVALSDGNLTVTGLGTTSADQGARLADSAGKSSGKYYFEQTILYISTSPNRGVGIGTPTSTYTAMGAGGTTGVHMYPNSGGIYSMGSPLGGIAGRAVNDVIGIAVDLDNRKIWFRPNPGAIWNNAAPNDPVANVGGVVIPAGVMLPFVTFGGTSGVAGNSFRANLGATAFAGAVPAGYTAGWPA
jgi:hypothetical protein